MTGEGSRAIDLSAKRRVVFAAYMRIAAAATAIQLLAVLGHHSPLLSPVGWANDAVTTVRDFFRLLWSPLIPVLKQYVHIALTPLLTDALTLYFLVVGGLFARGRLWSDEAPVLSASLYVFLIAVVFVIFAFNKGEIATFQMLIICALGVFLAPFLSLSRALFVPQSDVVRQDRREIFSAYLTFGETLLYAVGLVVLSKMTT